MPAPNHFGKLQARALTDPRILRASELYVSARLARPETALATVLGHIAMLGLWAARETDDGGIPGDGIALVASATLCGPVTARKVVPILKSPDVDIITGPEGALRLRGYDDAYGSLARRRDGGAERVANWRARNASGNAPRNALRNGVGTDTEERRVEEKREAPPPPERGESAAPAADGPRDDPHGAAEAAPPDLAGKPLRPRELERFGKVLEYVIKCSGVTADERTARELRQRHAAGQVPDTEIIALLAGKFAWVTRERLARWVDTPTGHREEAGPSAAPTTTPRTAVALCQRHGRSQPCSVCEATTPPTNPGNETAAVAQAIAALRKRPRPEAKPEPRPELPATTSVDPAEFERRRLASIAALGSS